MFNANELAGEGATPLPGPVLYICKSRCFRGPLLALIVKDSSEMRRMQKEVKTTKELASLPTGVAGKEWPLLRGWGGAKSLDRHPFRSWLLAGDTL